MGEASHGTTPLKENKPNSILGGCPLLVLGDRSDPVARSLGTRYRVQPGDLGGSAASWHRTSEIAQAPVLSRAPPPLCLMLYYYPEICHTFFNKEPQIFILPWTQHSM